MEKGGRWKIEMHFAEERRKADGRWKIQKEKRKETGKEWNGTKRKDKRLMLKAHFAIISLPPKKQGMFYLFPSFYLIIIYLPWWKIAFSARLSSTLIFHLPPSAIAWKTFLISSYSEVYFLFLVSFPLKKHFHILACLFENALPFFRKSFVICRLGYSLLPVRPISCPLFPFSRLPE